MMVVAKDFPRKYLGGLARRYLAINTSRSHLAIFFTLQTGKDTVPEGPLCSIHHTGTIM